MQEVTALGNGDVEMFEKVKQPVYINGNAYLKGAGAFDREKENYISQADPQVKIVSEGDAVYLEMNVEKEMLSMPTEVIDTQKLGMVRLVEAPFDDPDGNPVVLDTDYLGNTREAGSAAGAFADLKEGLTVSVYGAEAGRVASINRYTKKRPTASFLIPPPFWEIPHLNAYGMIGP